MQSREESNEDVLEFGGSVRRGAAALDEVEGGQMVLQGDGAPVSDQKEPDVS